jgi:hypothetical protein
MKEILKDWIESIKSESRSISYIKCWLLGSFYSFGIGCTLIFFFLSVGGFYPNINEIPETEYLFYFGPFLGALIIKLIKKDTPGYIYSTTGLIFIIIFYYYVHIFYAKVDDYFIPFNWYAYHSLFKYTVGAIIGSFLGGFIVDIYNIKTMSSPYRLSSNIKYWLLGNFISFSIGWTALLFLFFAREFYPNTNIAKIIAINIFTNYFLIYFGPFLGALVIKFIKEDIPWYVYNTAGVIFIIIFSYSIDFVCPFLTIMFDTPNWNLITIKEAVDGAFGCYGINHFYAYDCVSTYIMYGIIASFLGGVIVDTCRYLKLKYSKTVSSPYLK